MYVCVYIHIHEYTHTCTYTGIFSQDEWKLYILQRQMRRSKLKQTWTLYLAKIHLILSRWHTLKHSNFDEWQIYTFSLYITTNNICFFKLLNANTTYVHIQWKKYIIVSLYIFVKFLPWTLREKTSFI